MNRIAVIVPVYNVAPYLRRCVDSILRQTYVDFLLVLVDDGSTDESPKICDQYLHRDKRVRVIHRENGGLSTARNTGIEYVLNVGETEYIAFIDSDDWVHTEYLKSLYDAIGTDKISACWCQAVSSEDKAKDVSQWSYSALTPEAFWVKNRIAATVAWGKLYAVELFRELRYPNGKIHEDEYVTYKVLFSQDRVQVTFAPLYYYYQRTTSIIGSKWNEKHLQAFPAFDEQLDFFEKKRLYLAYQATALSYLRHIVASIKAVEKDSNLRNKYCLKLRSSLAGVYNRVKCRTRINLLGDYQVASLLFPIKTMIFYPVVRIYDVLHRRGWVWMIRRLLNYKH